MTFIHPLQKGIMPLSLLLNRLFSRYDLALTNFAAGDPFRRLLLNAATDRTINASGYITATTSYHRVDTAGAAASDNLDEIRSGAEGDILVLLAMSETRTVVCRHDVVNIWSNNAENFNLSATIPTVFRYNGTYWVRCGSTPAAGAAPTREFLLWRLTTSTAGYAAATNNLLTWDAEDYDTAGWGAPGGTLSVPDGRYLVSAQHHWDSVTSVSCLLKIVQDGTIVAAQSNLSSQSSFIQQASTLIENHSGGTTNLSVYVRHDTGTVGRANSNYYSNFLSVEKLV